MNNDVLVIHSPEIIRKGVVSVFNKKGFLTKRYYIDNKDFVSLNLLVDAGLYTIIINTDKNDKVIKANIKETNTSKSCIKKRIDEINENHQR